MLDWLRRRRLSQPGRKKLLIAMARAEESLIETHVSNILDIAEALDDEVEIDRAVELYLDRIHLDDGLATSVTNRLLANLDNPDPAAARRDPRYPHVFRERR
jgi:hypothetical protein